MTLACFLLRVKVLIQLTLLIHWWYTFLTQTTLAATTTFTSYNENSIQDPELAFVENFQIEHEKVNCNKLVLYVEHIKNPSPIAGFILGRAVILFGRFLLTLMD